MVMFAPKNHKENVKNIHDFIWRLCVSYRALNTVKQFFTFAISRCADSIEVFGDLNGPMFFITLDARQGCHQITVRFWDQEKLAFFCPDSSKKKFEVMPFGTKNAPSFYTAMIKQFQGEWDVDFTTQSTIDKPNPPSMLTSSTPSASCKVTHGSKIVTDNILLYSTNVYTLLRYFACVARIFVRYRLSLKLSKCKFFSPRVDYLGYDLTARGNCSAQSKFNLLTDWTLPNHGTPLSAFIGLCA